MSHPTTTFPRSFLAMELQDSDNCLMTGDPLVVASGCSLACCIAIVDMSNGTRVVMSRRRFESTKSFVSRIKTKKVAR